MRKLAHVKPRNHLTDLEKIQLGKREKEWLLMNKKKDRFATATGISKRLNSNLGIKVSRQTISWRLNKIDLNCRVASTMPYISKKNKMSRSKFAAEHVIWIEEKWCCVFFSDESNFNQFDCDERRFIRRSSKDQYSPQGTKMSVIFRGRSLMVFGMIQLLVQDLISGYTVKLTQLYTKTYWRNMLYLIWELQLINQLYLSKTMFRVTQRSLLRHFFLRRMLLLWSRQLKAKIWILLRMFGSY